MLCGCNSVSGGTVHVVRWTDAGAGRCLECIVVGGSGSGGGAIARKEWVLR